MTAEEWKCRIQFCMEELGTYQGSYDDVIDTLADVLSKRDMALKTFEEQGSEIVLERVDRNGTNVIKRNPLLVVVNEYNAQALSYWRELGLTPAGYKKLKDALQSEKKSSLVEALNGLLQS